MSSVYGDEHAFPNGRIEYQDVTDIQRGMNIRTYLTGQSIPAAALFYRYKVGASPELIAARAVAIADAVIQELNRKSRGQET